MKNWSICNISEGMESEVKLSPDDIIDSFLNENGIYAGSPLLEFIDIKKLRRSLLNEMDADIPRVVDRPAMVRPATEPTKIISSTIQQAQYDKTGGISIEWKIKIPKFDDTNLAAKNSVIIKARSDMDQAKRQSIYKICELYDIQKPNLEYFKVISNQIAFNIAGIPIDKDRDGRLDLTAITPDSELSFSVDFKPTHPAFRQAARGLRKMNAVERREDVTIDQYNADTNEAAQNVGKPPAQPMPKSGPSFSPTGMPTYDPRGN